MRKIKQPLALYIHIPFCRRKCLYCDFLSYPGRKEMFPVYLKALELEMEQYLNSGLKVATIFIGGGTPTVLPAEAVTRILEKVRGLAEVLPGAEITIEANPGSVTKEQLALFLQAGINRLSLGAQSGQDTFLKALGRSHTVKEVEKTVVAARKSGFTNINLDLIYGLPGEMLDDWARTLKWAVSLGPQHLSCYGLQVEEGTPLARMVKEGRLTLPDDDEISEMFLLNTEFLPAAGYHQYEISNFARGGAKGTAMGYRCRHNLFYWKYRDYLGLGPDAYSCFSGNRWANLRDLDLYIKLLNEGKLPVAARERISKQQGMAEFIMLGLRLTEGPDPVIFKERWGKSLEAVLGSRALPLIDGGFLRQEQGTYQLTPEGMLVSNRVLTELLAPLL